MGKNTGSFRPEWRSDLWGVYFIGLLGNMARQLKLWILEYGVGFGHWVITV